MLIVAACLGVVTCGGASCLSVLNFEPPHPHRLLSVSDAVAHPERAKESAIEDADYDVWINLNDGACSLAVKNADGKLLGKSTRGMCRVSLTGHKGDTWSFEATASAPDAEIDLAFSNPLFPKPLGRIALGGALFAALSVLGAVLASLLGRSAPMP